MNKFEALGLNDELLKAIEDMGFTQPSEIQEKAIPALLDTAIDLVALAQTGTGKTAAFGFPMIQNIDADSRTTQGLIIAPTRELCLQISKEMEKYAKFYKSINVVAVYGGANITEQAKKIKRGAQIIVATPGRMKDMIRRRLVDISKIEICVLDEADEMLNMGFYEDITDILSHTPDEKSTWLFSATMPKEVARIAKEFMYNPEEITVGSKNVGASTVSHEYYVVGARDRYAALKRLSDAHPEIFSVVFCRTKRDTQAVAEKLIADGYNAAAIHGDLSQGQRDSVMKSFRTRQIQTLVATDVAARGIDVDDITHVIHYQLPDEIEVYTHRSGRTGRAGKSGVSMVLLTKSEMRKIKAIERIIGRKFEAKKIPDGMEICEMQLFHLVSRIKNTEINPEIETYIPAIQEVLGDMDKDELIQKMVSVEFTKFLNYYKRAKDLNVDASSVRGATAEGGNSTRFFINVGEKDGYDWMSLKDLIKDVAGLGRDDVFRADCMTSFSFFNVDQENVEKVLESFEGYELDGRRISVEITKKKEGGRSFGGRGRGRSDRSRRRRDGGAGRRRSDDRGGNRSESRGRSSDRGRGRDDRGRSRDDRGSGDRDRSFGDRKKSGGFGKKKEGGFKPRRNRRSEW